MSREDLNRQEEETPRLRVRKNRRRLKKNKEGKLKPILDETLRRQKESE